MTDAQAIKESRRIALSSNNPMIVKLLLRGAELVEARAKSR
jgi:hypothetical protein